jgi:hypothetical protein
MMRSPEKAAKETVLTTGRRRPAWTRVVPQTYESRKTSSARLITRLQVASAIIQ